MGSSFSKVCEYPHLLEYDKPTSSSHSGCQLRSRSLKMNFRRNSSSKSHCDDVKKVYNGKYEQVGKISQGGFSKVFLVKKITTNELFALKKISKRSFNASENSITIENVMTEKRILQKVNNPFIIRLNCSFQDERNLYYVVEYAKGGTITKYLKKQKYFSEDIVKFYSGEIILALKSLHVEHRVIYRDLKPDNVLIGEDGHLKLTDFGLSTIDKSFSITGCGTPEFIAPEILNNKPHSRMVDYWSFGCLLYLFLFGIYPFYDPEMSKQFDRIKKGQYVFPEEPKVSQEAKNLISKLLKVDTDERLGSKGIGEIMTSSFYSEIDWDDLYQKKNDPPLKAIESKLKEDGFEFSPATSIRVENFSFDPDIARSSRITANQA